MSRPDIEPGYPLAWPTGRPRYVARKEALFRDRGSRMTLTTAKRRLADQIYGMTRHGQSWRTTDMVLSTNIRYTASGARDQNVSRRDPTDPGVAFYFALDGRSHVLACDRWDTVQDNIAAIAAHIDALRGQERWGVADLKQAFAGHVALPPPPSWRKSLELGDGPVTPQQLDAAYRHLARAAHPDAGGSRDAWDRLTAAYEAGKLSLGR